MQKYYGHSLAGYDQEHWEPLADHLQLVAQYSEWFTEKLKATDWGQLLAWWHDLGKYDPRFQNYLLTENGFEAHLETTGTGKVNHSTFGGQYAVSRFTGPQTPFGYLLAYCILGHHAGLPDYQDTNAETQKAASLFKRLQDETTRLSLETIPEFIRELPAPGMPAIQPIKGDPKRFPFQLSFWTRMLFSCLVDADFLATEEFMSPERTKVRPQAFGQWKQLQGRLAEYLTEKGRNAAETPLGKIRHGILQACETAALLPPGFFSLTVPTGGGKTLSSLSFALRHVCEHQKDRIIYAIPFTSIVEQTARVFRESLQGFGSEEIVLEHHCNVDPEQEEYRSRLASENWDAPLIVTTNVQLLESLYAAKPSRCRKLHRLVNSVIILDEAQTLPVEYLQPCLQALQELVTNYGCTVVLCTATQPAVEARDDFKIGLQGVREMIPDPEELARKMRRVEIASLGKLTPAALTEQMLGQESFLAIVNYKADARKLYQLVQAGSETSDGIYHLSTNLCAEHRFRKLNEIRERLKNNQPCRVISTQLIEAGVDVDFPVVFRAIAGLDSIAQAAGRCNREGNSDSAMVYVFETSGEEWGKLRGYQKRTADITRGMILDGNSLLHQTGWLSTQTIEQYFRENYWSHADLWDKQEILPRFRFSGAGIPEFDFRQVARDFRLIDDYQIPVFVRYDEKAAKLLEALRQFVQEPDRKTVGLEQRKILRQLQRYSVGVSDRVFASMRGKDISVLTDHRGEPTEFYELTNQECYHEELGFQPQQAGIMGVEESIL